MTLHLSTQNPAIIACTLLLHLCATGGVPSGYAIAPNVATSTALYKAPSHYSKESPLQSFIITSRPISFHSDSYKQEGNSLKSPLVQTKGQVTLTSVPGVATIVCKGISCASSATSFADLSPPEDDGFPGEAIPVDESEYMTAMVGQHQPQAVVAVNSVVKQGPTQSVVHLLTNRPYLRRGSSKRKPQAPTRKTYVERRSTTATSTLATTRRRPVALAQVATTTARPAASSSRPTIMLQRPSLVFPAMAAFGLMALPVAAAAVPLLLQGRRRRRSLPARPRSLPDDSSETDFWELMSSLEDLEKEMERVEWPADGRRHLAKAAKARHQLRKIMRPSRGR